MRRRRRALSAGVEIAAFLAGIPGPRHLRPTLTVSSGTAPISLSALAAFQPTLEQILELDLELDLGPGKPDVTPFGRCPLSLETLRACPWAG